jgi:L-asparaginase/Glu-tRNA(Gln) amidotransferase subunit D
MPKIELVQESKIQIIDVVDETE